MTKLHTLKTTVEWAQLSDEEMTEFIDWLNSKRVNKPTEFALSILRVAHHRRDTVVNNAETPEHLRRLTMNDSYLNLLIHDLCNDWTDDLIDWEYVFKGVCKGD
jgi:hypothetical protein